MERRKSIQCCKCGKGNNRTTRFVCLSCGEVFCKNCYNEREEINNHKSNHPVQQVMSKLDLELFYGGAQRKGHSVLIKDQPITCPCCGEKGLSSSDLVEHMIRQHHSKNSNKVLCPLCLCGFENISKEAEFHGRNILQHLCVYHQLMPYYDDDDDDDDDQNDDDDDDDDDDYDDPHEMPGQKRPLSENHIPNEMANDIGPGGDGYAVRKTITFLNIEGEPFTFGEDGDNPTTTAPPEIGAGDAKQNSSSGRIDSAPANAVDPMPPSDRSDVQLRNVASLEDSFASTSRTGLIRRNAMRLNRGQGSRQRMNDLLSGGRSRIFPGSSDNWDVGPFVPSQDHTSQRNKRNAQSRGQGLKMTRGGGVCNSAGGRRAEPAANLRQHFDDLLDDCMASNFLRDSSIASELLTYMNLRRRQDGGKNNNPQNPGTLSFEERRAESDLFWKHFRASDGSQQDRNKERKPDKKQRTSDSSELWAQAFDCDTMDYLTEHEADFDQYDEFYDDAEGYELFDGEDDDEYEDEEDEEEEDDEDEDGCDDIEDRAARICVGLKSGKEKNVLKLIMSGDKATKQMEKEPLTTTTTAAAKTRHSNEDKFLLGTNFWQEYHDSQPDLSESRANENLFVQELFFTALNALSIVEENLSGSEPVADAPPKETKQKEGEKDEKKNTKGKKDGNKQAKTKGDAQRTKLKHREVGVERKSENLVSDQDHLSSELKVVEGHRLLGDGLERSRLNSGAFPSGTDGADRVLSERIEEPESTSATIPSEIKSSGNVQHAGNSTREGQLVDCSDLTFHQPAQNNYGARPKDRSYNSASRNSFGNAAPIGLPPRKSDARRSSSGFVSSSSSSVLSSHQEIPNGRKRSSKNSSAVSSSSNLSDFSSPSAGLSPATNSGLLVDEANGGNGSGGVAPHPSHSQVGQVRSDNYPPGKVATKTTSQVVNGFPKKNRMAPALQMQSGNPAVTKNPSFSNRGFVQQQNQQRTSRQIGSGQLPPLKPGRSSVGGSGSATRQNNPGNNSNPSNQAAVSIPTPGIGSSSGTNGHPAADNPRNNKPPCNNARNKSILSQKDKTSFR